MSVLKEITKIAKKRGITSASLHRAILENFVEQEKRNNVTVIDSKIYFKNYIEEI